jgi:ABC-type transporter Mla subunit MlaD
MADGASSAYGSSGLGELLAMFGGANPFAGISKSVAQFQRGVSQFMDSVDKFNDTMEQLNQVSRRVNGLLDTVEEPVRAMVPQITRTIRAADMLVEQLNGPIEKVAPGLARLADTLSSPTLTALPRDLAQFMEVLGDLAHRLQPLGQLAESAGSMFGLRPLAALRSGVGARPAPAPRAPTAPLTYTEPAREAAVKRTPAKKTTARRAPAKKAAAKKAAAKKAPAKRAPARTTAAKKTAAKNAPAKR